ncbi:major facilitator superfamily domain-containing protein [Ilyonectria destructans]|nr:major facilitator superfamily domain-containing protein [Ilyonectria destructans]
MPPIQVLPPGTAYLNETQGGARSISKPSTDPDDPLNWVRWRKRLNVSLMLSFVFTTGIGGTAIYSVLDPISQDTGMTIGQLVTGTGYLFLFSGWGNLIWQPLALTFGRRPTIIFSLIGAIAASEWTAWLSEFPSWVAARCLYGFVVAPMLVLPEICIPDLFSDKERGTYIAWYMLVLCGSNFLAPLIAGFLSDAYGWRQVQHGSAILLSLDLLLILCLYEETMYSHKLIEADDLEEMRRTLFQTSAEPNEAQSETRRRAPTARQFWKNLRLFSYSGLSVQQALTIAYRPVLILFRFPNITWASFMYGSALAWFNVYNATTSSILSAPPYNFPASTVGLTYVAPLIGTAIAGVVSGPIADWSTLRLARRFNNLREPEYRLWGLVIFCILMPTGLLLWGLGAAFHVHWAILLFGSILCGYCNVAGGSYAIAYAVDCFRELAGETVVSMILCRNTMAFAVNYAITPWINAQGLQNTFIAVSVLSCAIGCTFLLMIWKGKQLRAASAERYWRYVAIQAIEHP